MERTIRVTGKGHLPVKPDTIRLNITQTEMLTDYEDALLFSARRKQELTEGLSTLGFRPEDLKTIYFNVDTEQESYQAKDKSWKHRLLGYRYTHRMRLSFPIADGKLGKVLAVLANSSGEPEFSINNTVADATEPRNELLAQAVADSMAKAQLLARAAGVKLGDLQTIDYSWGQIDIVSPPMMKMEIADCCIEPGEIDLDMEAEDIELNDTVTVVWKIN